MTDIYSIRLLDILPPNLRDDPDIIAASRALDSEFLLLVNTVGRCIILPDIDSLDSDMTDLLAWELHLDFYDDTLPLDVRHELVKNAILWHMRKGTPAAVEELIAAIFGDGEVKEWFEYGGEPYMFKVLTNNGEVTTTEVQRFTRAIEAVKNTRSHLEAVEITLTDNMNLYLGGLVHVGEFCEIRQVV